VPHQIDTARLLAGGIVKSVRALASVLDPSRPTEGSCAALLQFGSGAAASIVYSGYDHFDTDEWHFGISERGAPKPIVHGAARRALASARDETKARTETFAYGNTASELPPHQPHFGITIVTCANGDMRASADGVTIYGRDGVREIPLPRGGSMPGRREVLDDLAAAIRTGKRPVHDGRWGKATVEVALAILRSSREGREVMLEHQVTVDGSPG
jgi:phthalate 4,5-cis-dihydrodiol dehydrogenase